MKNVEFNTKKKSVALVAKTLFKSKNGVRMRKKSVTTLRQSCDNQKWLSQKLLKWLCVKK